ncbi:MAG: hypothetical protein AAFU79_33190, partial [Myxococcota bacterium]
FEGSPRLSLWKAQRGAPLQAVEKANLIEKLMLFPDSEAYPLARFGLSSSSASARAREVFPNYEKDPLEAQACLAYLLLKFRISVTVTLGPGFDVVIDRDGDVGGLPDGSMKNPPIAFDFSHQSHRGTQAFMWSRILGVADGLIRLLKEEELGDGVSFWDRSLIYFATEFGRTRNRPANADDFGSGHDLDNGALIVSPLVKGDTVLGGMDPNTGYGYGYDPVTGAPDRNRKTVEAEVFSGLLDVLGVDTTGAGLPAAGAMRRS